MGERWMARCASSLLVLGLASTLAAGCSGSSLGGAVGGVELTVEDGFYTEFEWAGVAYYGVVLTDIPDACNAFRATDPDLGSTWGVFQAWITALDIDSYPVYSMHNLDEAGDEYALSWYTSIINSQEVVNTEGVAGVVQVTDYNFDDKVLSGSVDVIFSGNGNRLQGTFSASYCEVDWESVAEEMIAQAM